VRFLLDQNQSPRLVGLLEASGHDVAHVRDVGLATAPDEIVVAFAVESSRVLVSSDTDFGELLARSNASSPSILLFRRQGQRRAPEVAALLLANLPAIEGDLLAGAVVVFDDDRIRIRSLPLNP
jgi:predicted nuclease of predicted toxin-antitoxin system